MHTNHSFMCTSLHCKAIVLSAHNQAFNIGSVYLNLYSRWRRVTFNFLFLLKFRCIYHDQWNRVLTNEQTKWQDSDLLLIRIVFSPALCEKNMQISSFVDITDIVSQINHYKLFWLQDIHMLLFWSTNKSRCKAKS